ARPARRPARRAWRGGRRCCSPPRRRRRRQLRPGSSRGEAYRCAYPWPPAHPGGLVSDEHVTIDDILPRVEQLAGAGRVVTELPGGLTNTNYKVMVGGRSYVVRVSSKDAGLLAIDRENEYVNS